MDGKQLQNLLIKEGITPSSVEHRGEKRIKLLCKNEARLTSAIKQIPGRKWSRTMNAWHLPKDKKLLIELIRRLDASMEPSANANRAHVQIGVQPSKKVTTASPVPVSNQLPVPIQANEYIPELQPYIEKFSDKIHLKGYSYSTLKNYRNHFIQYLRVIASAAKQSPKIKEGVSWTTVFTMMVEGLTKDDIEKYLRWRQKHKPNSETDQNLHINAIKFYYEFVLGRERMLFDLPRPKRPYQLPAVLAEEDVVKIFRAVDNVKHRTMLMMAYAHGMRVSEVASLKLADMDSKRMQIHIHPVGLKN